MAVKLFKKVDMPYEFKEYFTKYPHGYTIFESLLNIVNVTNDMIGTVNKLSEGEITGLLMVALNEVAESGELASLIQELIIIDGGVF